MRSGRLQEVSNIVTFGILENWSLRRVGHNEEVRL